MLTFHEYNVSLHYLFVNGVSVANVDATISSIGPDVISFKYTAIIVSFIWLTNIIFWPLFLLVGVIKLLNFPVSIFDVMQYQLGLPSLLLSCYLRNSILVRVSYNS